MTSFAPEHLDKAHTKKVDIDGSTVYVGYALNGTLTSESKWSIKRITTGSEITVSWANNAADFSNVWDDRTSYPYS